MKRSLNYNLAFSFLVITYYEIYIKRGNSLKKQIKLVIISNWNLISLDAKKLDNPKAKMLL